MSAETLDQHRRELDAQFETLKTIRDYLELDRDASADLVELVFALRRRVERLEELVAASSAPVELDAGRHSRRVDVEQCRSTSPTYGVRCAKPDGHDGQHESVDRVYWSTGPALREAGRP